MATKATTKTSNQLYSASPGRRFYNGAVRCIGRKGSQRIVDKPLVSHNPRK